MDEWRTNAIDDFGHNDNINIGEFEGYMGAWIQKVVKCQDLPREKIVDGSAIDQNVKDWLELESLWYPT